MEVDGRVINTVAAVSDTLPMAVLLGIDVPELSSLLLRRVSKAKIGVSEAFVTTRAGARRKEEEERRDARKNELSGVRPTPAVAEQTWELGTELDDTIIQDGKQRPTQTRSQKRQNRREHRLKVGLDPPIEESLPEISAEELKALQEADPTLKALHGMVGKNESEDGIIFKLRNGLLYRVGKEREMQTREQLVLPTECHRVVMELAHSIPLAGHLGKHKTTDRTLQRFYWPTLRRDVAEFCRH